MGSPAHAREGGDHFVDVNKMVVHSHTREREGAHLAIELTELTETRS